MYQWMTPTKRQPGRVVRRCRRRQRAPSTLREPAARERCYFVASFGPVVALAVSLSVLVDLAVVFATEVVVSCCSVAAFVVDAVRLAAAVSSWRFTADGKIAFAISWRPLRIDVTMLGVLVRRRRPQNICRAELVC